MKKILVLIPMYGKEDYTRKCIELTLKHAGVPVDILIVDDGSPEPLRYNNYADEMVAVLRLEENTGFTNATNQGLLWAGERYDYIHCLNNDTEPRPDFIKHLLDIMENDPLVGIAGSVREYVDGRIELCGADLIRGHQYFADSKLPESPLEVNWLPICSALIRVDMVREIGLLDKRFRNHCSDADYCIQAKMRGWRVILDPKSRVLHHLSVTTTASKVNPQLDQKLFVEKIACLDYARLMKEMPLDMEQKAYGKLSFEMETR